MTDTKRYAMLEYNQALIEGMDNKAEYIKAVLMHCKPWLDQEVALRHYKALAGFLAASHGMWKNMAGPTLRSTRETKLAVTEILRRAERALMLAVKEGQEHGEIGKQGELGGWESKRQRHGEVMTIEQATGFHQNYLQEFRPLGQLTSEEFENALAKAREMGRPSRTGILRIAAGEQIQEMDWVPHQLDRRPEALHRRLEIIRELAEKGYDSRQMVDRLGTGDVTIRQLARDAGIEIPADKLTQRTKHIRADRVVTEAASVLEGVAASLALANVWELDRNTIHELRLQMGRSTRAVTAFMADMRNVEEKDREHGNNDSARA